MKLINLTRGFFAIVDDENFEYLNQWKWQCSAKGYVTRTKRVGERKNNKKKTFRMHRVILNLPDGFYVDHINHNKLDNRKCNLRIATDTQNLGNMKTPRHNSTGFKGVSFDKSRNKYEVYITKKDKKIHLGRYNTKKEAAQAYNKAAQEYFGEYAKLNTL
jgi:hypothetical protein